MVAETVSEIRQDLGVDVEEWEQLLEHAKLIFVQCKATKSCGQKSRGWNSVPSFIRNSAYMEVWTISLKELTLSKFTKKHPSLDNDGCKRIFTIVTYRHNQDAARKRRKQVNYLSDTCREQRRESPSLFSGQSVDTDVPRKRRFWWVILLMMGMIWVGYNWQMFLGRKESRWERVGRSFSFVISFIFG